jgi:hypothetical protein
MVLKSLAVFCAVFLLTSESFAANPKDQIPGVWRLKKIKGAFCASQIDDLEYYFGADGRYEVRANMNRINGVNKEMAKGTYVADDRTITARAEGYTLGPHRYRIEGRTMIMVQNPPGCEIYLDKEDE